jgi:LPXTG-motif cell wall-anchored protein
MKRLVLTLILAAAALLGASMIAPVGTASAYPTGNSPVIRINVSSTRTDLPFTVTISPCIAGETVIFRFRDQVVTTTCSGNPLSASATFIPRIRPNGLVDRSLGAEALVAQAPTPADVPAPGIYEVCGDLTGTGVTVPPGTTRPATLCTQIEVLADAPPTTAAPPVTSPGGGLPATGSNGLGTTTTSGIVLLSAGALLLIVAQVRRRRTAAA